MYQQNHTIIVSEALVHDLYNSHVFDKQRLT